VVLMVRQVPSRRGSASRWSPPSLPGRTAGRWRRVGSAPCCWFSLRSL